jgi:hypothetical protein
MNPKYLLKDELIYQLAIRGINVEGDVHLLRKLFRSVLLEDVPVVPEILAGLDFGKLLNVIAPNVAELDVLVRNGGTGRGNVAARLRTRALHLRNRLLRITGKQQVISGSALAKTEDLRG